LRHLLVEGHRLTLRFRFIPASAVVSSASLGTTISVKLEALSSG
jgi:hypothetical protein